jgi:hypothetical protein
MKVRRLTSLLIAAAAVSASAPAQWPLHVPADAPRTAEGRPDLGGPVPRLSNGRPDLSGVWDNRVPPAGRLGAPMLMSSDGPPVATFFEVGANVPGGLPFTPWAAELQRQRMATFSRDNPDAHCLPIGFMQLHTHSQARKIVQTPYVTVIMYEANYGLRQIFTDGRTLPSGDPQPWWYGYSVGHWDGDTLVVETSGFRDDGWLDVNGSPFTDTLKTTEQFRRASYGRLEVDVTVDDPKAYTKPWTVRINYRLLPGDALIEFVCLENEQSSKHLVN